MQITRTYETFSIEWTDGSRWSGYDSADEAQRVIDAVVAYRTGVVARKTFDFTFHAELADLYRPGIAESREVTV